MQVKVLASGSKGNSTYIELDGVRILIDVGISVARIKSALADIDVDINTLDAVLLTHEHIDHVRGLATLSRHYDVPIMGTSGTLNSIELPNIETSRFISLPNNFCLGEVNIKSFPIMHDAAEPVGYRISGSKNFTFATDLGFVTPSVQDALEGADIIVLEANHDPEMLKNGSYPWGLKRRILSNKGHLANQDAGWALARLRKRPGKVFLAHLSEENNRPDVAYNTVTGILAQNQIAIRVEVGASEGHDVLLVDS